MVKMKIIGDKKEILKKRLEQAERKSLLDAFADKTDKQLGAWLDQHFSTLPEESRAGLETIVKTLWVHTRFTKK